jgi:hypothetical protein
MVIGVVGVFFLSALNLWAQPLYRAPQPAPAANLPSPLPPAERQERGTPVKRVAPGIFRVGEIEINKGSKSVSFPAVVNQDRGLLEYLLVRNGGKTHESLLRTQVQPYDLQVAFLLLGFEGSDAPLRFQGAPERPRGEAVTIAMSLTGTDGKAVSLAPEAWVVKKTGVTSSTIDRLDWVFTGSVIVSGRFLAQDEGSIIALYHDPVAMIDNASEGGESDKVWFVREGIPPVGTPVTLTIQGR